MPLNRDEEAFLVWWAANRDRQRKIGRQFLLGIPVALLFVIPIAINFLSGWYKRADMEAHNPDFNPGVLLAALLIIVGFIAIFSRQLRWERYEQQYKSILQKKEAEKSKENL